MCTGIVCSYASADTITRMLWPARTSVEAVELLSNSNSKQNGGIDSGRRVPAAPPFTRATP